MLKVAFLWHMHQPCYRDALTNEVALPWVRLHACQSYLDMASTVDKFDNVRVNFNIVPSLIYQLKEYSEKGFNGDVFYDLSMKDPDDLSEDDAIFILRHFFSVHWDSELRPYPGYLRLLERRGIKDLPEHLAHVLKECSKQDLFDLQVWFNLAWFGFTAKKMYPQVDELKRKGRDFTPKDKETIFNCQLEIVKSIIPSYAKLWEEGKIEITTSPFYHPILPLLINTYIAKRASPDMTLPVRFSEPEDARAQLANAKKFVAETLGKEPAGLWPSEGSVCPELIPILEEVGFKYFVTDQEILYITCGHVPECTIYQPYLVEIEGKKSVGFFRDRELSDKIGFVYSKNPPEVAASDFIGRLEKTASQAKTLANPIAVVALDGENPWEYYKDKGEGFLNRVYAELDKKNKFESVRLGDYVEKYQSFVKLFSLHSGSWINANFKIWIGHPEKNRGWEVLNRVRSFVRSFVEKVKPQPELLEKIMDQIYRAEGSDWFWWFGDDFLVLQDTIFDQLFRKHLENVYRLCSEEVPDFLSEQIKIKPTQLVIQPLAFIQPIIDGRNTSYYEWELAGYYNAFKTRGTTHTSRSLLSGLYFGFDEKNLFIRLDLVGPLAEAPELYNFKIDFSAPIPIDVMFNLTKRGQFVADIVSSRADGLIKVGELKECAYDKVVEMKVPFDVLNAKTSDMVRFVVRIFKDQIEDDRHPKNGLISFTVPDKDFENAMWSA